MPTFPDLVVPDLLVFTEVSVSIPGVAAISGL